MAVVVALLWLVVRLVAVVVALLWFVVPHCGAIVVLVVGICVDDAAVEDGVRACSGAGGGRVEEEGCVRRV